MLFAKKVFFALGIALVSHAAWADERWFDSASVELGQGDRVKQVRVALQSKWDTTWFASNGTHLGAYWDVSLGAWHGTYYREVVGQTQNLFVIGATPVLRFENDNHKGWFFEGAIGYYLFSKLYDNAGNQLSTAFQFGDQLGVGYAFDNKWQFDAKVRHYSNAGIKHPNSGVNFGAITLTHSF